MYKIFYQVDYLLQKILTSLLFSIPIISLIKRSYYYLRFKSFRLFIGHNVAIVNPKNNFRKTVIISQLGIISNI